MIGDMADKKEPAIARLGRQPPRPVKALRWAALEQATCRNYGQDRAEEGGWQAMGQRVGRGFLRLASRVRTVKESRSARKPHLLCGGWAKVGGRAGADQGDQLQGPGLPDLVREAGGLDYIARGEKLKVSFSILLSNEQEM